jgi:ribosomal protein L11 methyltransferase
MAAWLEFRIQVESELVEPLVNLFARYVKTAPSIEEPGGFNPDDDETAPTDVLVTVRAFLPLNRNAKTQRARIEAGYQLLSLIQPLPPLMIRTLHAQEWEATVNAFVKPLRVGDRLVLCPLGMEFDALEKDIVVILEPGLGFGTGHHPTTRMCLEEIEKRLRNGMSVLDFGTGSGVLALVSIHLGAAHVVAVDRDPQALKAARRNVRRGGLPSRKVQIVRAIAPPVGHYRFDLIVANITARVVIEMAPKFVESLAPEGQLVVSGILVEQETDVVRRFDEVGLSILGRRDAEGWVTIVGKKKLDGNPN